MTLEDLGYNSSLEDYRIEHQLSHLEVGRVIAEHKERYDVKSVDSDFECELLGNLRFSAASRADLPAVGDWVAFSPYDDSKALIHRIFPRHSVLERQSVGKSTDKQIIAANIDFGLIVLAVNRDFNINRVQRYSTICNAAKVTPILILSKIDLISEDELAEVQDLVKERNKSMQVVPLSNLTHEGLDAVKQLIIKGKTYCLLGSSGVGKSTLLNNLLGKQTMKTGEISEAIDRGKHVTTHRELIVLDEGGIIIDNPGMREVGITSSSEAMAATFDDIAMLSKTCKFRDCQHINEEGCAVLDALAIGQINEDSYQNYQKMERERSHYDASEQEKRQRDRKFGKMVKRIMKEKKKRKY